MTSAAANTATHEQAGPDDLETLVSVLRDQIDDLDQALLRLVDERRALSRQIQSARVAAGGVRVELSRERQILGTYAEGLGAPGTALATAVLRACRGPL
jgi:chorismate mutase